MQSSNDPTSQARLSPIVDELLQGDGFIVIWPEYHGMAPLPSKRH